MRILTGKIERRVRADVAYAVWRSWRGDGDDEFLPSRRRGDPTGHGPVLGVRAVAEADEQAAHSPRHRDPTNTARTSTTTHSPT